MSFSGYYWRKLLMTAMAHGWIPAGTVLGHARETSSDDVDLESGGPYDTNDGAVVSVVDARNLANALRHAVLDIPSDERETVQALIRFCEQGDFAIY